jgi:hypothetical protein
MTTIDTKTEGRSAPEVLAWSRTIIEPALRSAVDTLPSSMRRIAGYHLGWCNEHGHPDKPLASSDQGSSDEGSSDEGSSDEGSSDAEHRGLSALGPIAPSRPWNNC